MSRWRPPYPPAVVRPPLTCPTTGLARYATRALAWLSPGWPIDLTPRQCTACHGGWHLIRPTEGDNR